MTIHIHYPHFRLPGIVRRHVFLTTALAAVVVAGAAAGFWLAQRSGGEAEAAEIDWVPEYAIDSPLVLMSPAVTSARYVGGDANLDPDAPAWLQPEYGVDTALVISSGLDQTQWVGGDANLDPDGPAWLQPEYGVDTALVISSGLDQTHWVGGDANLDPDE